MTEKQIKLRRKPFFVLSAVLFLLCFVPLAFFYATDPFLADPVMAIALVTVAVAFAGLMASLVAFAACGVAQVIRAFWVGDLSSRDLTYPAIVMALCGLLALAYAFIPKVAATAELSFIAICLVCWLCDIAWRIAKRVKKLRRRLALEPSVWK